MKLLLDTHAALWWTAADASLSSTALGLLRDDAHVVVLSAVVVWEVAIKRGLGKLDPGPDLRELVAAGGAVALPVSLAHAAAVQGLPRHHGDPFDRLLVAQAIVEDATLVSRDMAFADYDVRVAW